MNNSIYNEEEESDESLRSKSVKRIKLDHDNSSSSNSNIEFITTTINPNQNETTTNTTTTTTKIDQSPIITTNQKEEEENKQFTKEELLEYFENEFNNKRKSYVDSLLELFFLEGNGNFTDYFNWRKRLPSIPLLQYFKSIAKDNEEEFENLQYLKASLDGIDPNSIKIVPISDIQLPPSSINLNETQQLLTITSSNNNSITSSNLINQQSLQNQTQSLSSSAVAISSSTSTITSLSSNLIHQQQQQINNNNSSIHSNLNTLSTIISPSSLINSSLKSNVNSNQTHSSSLSSTSAPLSLSSKNVINNSTFNTPSSYQHLSSSSNNRIAQFNKLPSSSSSSLPSTPINSTISTKKSTRFHHHPIILPTNNSLISSTPPTSANISNVFESTIGSREQTVERAKAEIQIMQRVNELRKEGLWSARRLPRIQEPQRVKAHWDYLLEEMVWLAQDFAQERKWKKATAKKCARMIMKYHSDKDTQVEKAEKENQLRLRKIASSISKEIRLFWSSVEKLVEFKIQTKLEEKRKKALDSHLNFIVGQTEKYTEWLAEGLNKNSSNKEEEEEQIEEDEQQQKDKNDDEEFNLSSDNEEDFEDTIAEQEKHENKQNNALELKDLEDEANIPIEELLERYKDIYQNEESMDIVEEESDINDEEEDEEMEDEEGLTTMNDESDEEEQQSNDNEDENKQEIGVEYLINLKDDDNNDDTIESTTTTISKSVSIFISLYFLIKYKLINFIFPSKI